MTGRPRVAAVYAALAVGSAVWVAAVLAAPYFWSRDCRFSLVLYACFSPVCHQMPERSFWLFGHPLAVCARCFGIYAGFLAGLAAYPFVRGFRPAPPPGVRTILLFSLPVAVDTAAQFLGLWKTAAAGRFATGALWGAILPFLFVPALAGLRFPGLKRKPGKLRMTGTDV
ncbi:MAG: DUF2085 domain-containing protein [Candidatus Aminicenantes bacterium]|nr:DUF2085 domain-containing protein [Candidatus Aminicenantes bacterium]